MVKKLTLLAAAIAVVALAVPAFASASEVQLTGNRLATPAAIEGVSENATTETGLGTLECENVTIQGTLDTNNGSLVTGHGTGGTTAGCTVSGVGFNVTEPTLKHLESTTPGEGTVTLFFAASVFGIPCTFESSAPGPFTYAEGSDTIDIGASPVEGACGEGTFEGEFTLTSGGEALELF